MTGPDFRTPPFCASPHLQTILAVWVKRGRLPGRTVRHRVRLPDGDQLILHENTPRRWRPGDRVAIVVHGLTGNYRSGGVTMQADKLARRGFRVYRLDLRGAGASFPFSRKLYNAGCSEDLRAALNHVAHLNPGSPIALMGTSLGGNVALKLAGEAAERPIPQLACVAALNPPVDLLACTTLIALPGNRIYEKHFLGELIRDVRRLAVQIGVPAPTFPHRLSLQQFDDIYTAPVNGFTDALDYYRQSSSGPIVGLSVIPTLILTARDDPFVAVAPIEQLRGKHVQVLVSDRGGHTGFLGRRDLGWAETVIAGWLMGNLP